MQPSLHIGHAVRHAFDVSQIVDAGASKFQVLNMIDLGTTFQLCEVVRSGHGQPLSSECLKTLQKR